MDDYLVLQHLYSDHRHEAEKVRPNYLPEERLQKKYLVFSVEEAQQKKGMKHSRIEKHVSNINLFQELLPSSMD